MNGCPWIGVLIISTLTLGGCQHTPPTATPSGGAIVAPSEDRASGSISEVDLKRQVVTIKVIWQRRSFAVASDCRIITATNDHAELGDLKLGDDVDVAIVPGADLPVARRITVKGVTHAEREADREAERMERILTPNPAERAR